MSRLSLSFSTEDGADPDHHVGLEQRPGVRQHDLRGVGRQGPQPGGAGTPGKPLPRPREEGGTGAAGAPGSRGQAHPSLPLQHPHTGGAGSQGAEQGHERAGEHDEAGSEVQQHHGGGRVQTVMTTLTSC